MQLSMTIAVGVLLLIGLVLYEWRSIQLYKPWLRLRMLYLRVFRPQRHADVLDAANRLQRRLLCSPMVAYVFADCSIEACREAVLSGRVCEACECRGSDERDNLECMHNATYNIKTGCGRTVTVNTWTPEWCPKRGEANAFD